MKKLYLFVALALLTVIISGCSSNSVSKPTTSSDILKNPTFTVEQINESIIIAGIDNKTCLIKQIVFFENSDGDVPAFIISGEGVCNGFHAIAFEKKNRSEFMSMYHISLTDGRQGWIPDFLMFKNGICQTNGDCKEIIPYISEEVDRFGIPETVIGINDVCFHNTCVGCLITSDCKNKYNDKFCNISTNTCVECLTTRDCTGSNVCNQNNTCVDCLITSDCKNKINENVCNISTNTCVECLTDADCQNRSKLYYQKENYCFKTECVECRDNYDCPENEYCSVLNSCWSR